MTIELIFGIYWLICFAFLFIYALVEERIRHGKVDKDDFAEACMMFFPAPLLAPIVLVGELFCLLRWAILSLFNIGAKK